MSLKTRIVGNKFEAALWAVSIALVILFQGIITSYAQASMVAWSNGQTSVICSIHEGQTNGDEAPFKDLARSCCSILCQAACAVGAGLAALTLSFAYQAVFVARYHVVQLVVHGPPNFLAETYLPRGPPALFS
ncbi:hypothetical protein CES85_3953 [Ochrobactrum quorumnocens]|uniref:DUF2946 domain-containing protein n=1 Tax=Ochrobactrum quorumnocens TaxID=271865 RepID=A0A248U8X0_9HYPH|nr:hypothetical protein [[Ochrobactrum] quorumnocens]ASV83175.1 hypothetical protein CES85_3953 [[Ochrobactrum] quorumnocens]